MKEIIIFTECSPLYGHQQQTVSDYYVEFVIHNPENVTTRVNIVQTTSGDDSEEWIILESTNQLLQGENEFRFSPPNNELSTLYVDFEDGEIYIYLGSYS